MFCAAVHLLSCVKQGKDACIQVLMTAMYNESSCRGHRDASFLDRATYV